MCSRRRQVRTWISSRSTIPSGTGRILTSTHQFQRHDMVRPEQACRVPCRTAPFNPRDAHLHAAADKYTEHGAEQANYCHRHARRSTTVCRTHSAGSRLQAGYGRLRHVNAEHASSDVPLTLLPQRSRRARSSTAYRSEHVRADSACNFSSSVAQLWISPRYACSGRKAGLPHLARFDGLYRGGGRLSDVGLAG
jgi:hypothetical protein